MGIKKQVETKRIQKYFQVIAIRAAVLLNLSGCEQGLFQFVCDFDTSKETKVLQFLSQEAQRIN